MLLSIFALAFAVQADTPAEALTSREQAVHLLSRLAYAPTPAELARLERIGVERWLEEQLQPGQIAQPRLRYRLGELTGVVATPAEARALAEQEAIEASDGKARYGERVDLDALEPAEREALQKYRDAARDAYRRELYRIRFEFLGANLVRAVESDRQAEEVLADFWRNHFNVDIRKEQQEAALWMPEWEREVIRGSLWGDFETMLLATAQHPAMLSYLDQAKSRRPFTESELDRFRRREERRGRSEEQIETAMARYASGGPNENYARELMELHTLGVDNIYDQDDVVAVAEVFTGWTFRRKNDDPQLSYRFYFDERRHVEGDQALFGEPLPASSDKVGGGVEVLRRLAAHPGTAEAISRKLVERLVNDAPPEAIVRAAQERWQESDGNLTAVVEAIVLHPDFFSREHYQAKVKTPWEFVVSALRVLGAEAHDPRMALRILNEMGQPLYQCDVPTGWSDHAEDWLDPGAMAARWTFAENLAAGKVRGVHVPRGRYADWLVGVEPEAWAQALAQRIVPAGLSVSTQAVLDDALSEYLASRPVKRRGARAEEVGPQLTALLLGSPEFQRQ